jgi:A/G-specific adenine glycosylase
VSPPAELHDEVLGWYAAGKRYLPWRRTRDPYRILVSEVMLQQTQAARVVPRYERWLGRFPDEHALARAAPAEILREWSGLGYNRRALALHACAREVVAHGWPADAAGLRALPGVGPYTAAAVASFALGEQVAAVDVNVARVLGRWAGEELRGAALRERAAALLPRGRAADWNQALMELGATVCGARVAGCERCPVGACSSRGAVLVAPRRHGAGRTRFEDTDRYVRGRIVAELAAGERPRDRWGDGRWERCVEGLARDGLVVRDGDRLRLP